MVHVNPVLTVQSEEHPSSLVRFLSSQASGAITRPSLQPSWPSGKPLESVDEPVDGASVRSERGLMRVVVDDERDASVPFTALRTTRRRRARFAAAVTGAEDGVGRLSVRPLAERVILGATRASTELSTIDVSIKTIATNAMVNAAIFLRRTR